jgi:hypothetical protein
MNRRIQIFGFLSAIQLLTLVLWIKTSHFSSISSTIMIHPQPMKIIPNVTAYIPKNVTEVKSSSEVSQKRVVGPDWFTVDESVLLQCDQNKISTFFKRYSAYERNTRRARSKLSIIDVITIPSLLEYT